MRKPVIIFGAGGLGREVKTIVDILPGWFAVGFCDDHIAAGTMVMGIPVVGDCNYIKGMEQASIVVAIGDPIVKRDVVEKLQQRENVDFITIVHPRAICSDSATIHIGKGAIITAGCILTTSIRIGEHVLINLNSTIGHDSTIGNFSSIMPGVNIAGHVEIGNEVLIGSGANILNRVRVGERAVVGSGAVVLNDVASGQTVVGVPAKEIAR
jgi:sugar O-acyltransferase (sialic acid O-acetyltransferase NeuD family)